MQRSLLNLTANEASLVLELAHDDLSDLLRSKLVGLVAGGSSQLLSQDERESLLDLLPPPSREETDELRNLRQKLREGVS